MTSGTGSSATLIKLQDDWFQDVIPHDIGALLRDGTEWRAGGSDAARWVLSGRELYVLARGSLRGFLSVPRLVLGEEQVVLCTTRLFDEVSRTLASVRSPAPKVIDTNSGAPEGWVVLRNVRPAIAPQEVFPGILDLLRPDANVSIELEDGIKIGRQKWLAGYPPNIRLRGTVESVEVRIDGRVAVQAGERFTVDGWDALGEHSVWCPTNSRTYSVATGDENWEPWDAYVWDFEETEDERPVGSRPAVCGVLVRDPAGSALNHTSRVHRSNPVLLGHRPGEIYCARFRSDVNMTYAIARTTFEPVWALPADSLHAHSAARIRLIGPPREALGELSRRPARGARAHNDAVQRWCAAVLAAGRKRLAVEPAEPGMSAWLTYVREARRLSRGHR